MKPALGDPTLLTAVVRVAVPVAAARGEALAAAVPTRGEALELAASPIVARGEPAVTGEPPRINFYCPAWLSNPCADAACPAPAFAGSVLRGDPRAALRGDPLPATVPLRCAASSFQRAFF